MRKPQNKFYYSLRSYKMIHWGCSFDSLTELKFAISIQDEWDFLRERVTIYYHHGTLQPTSYIREGIRHYTPDFLMRHKENGQAFLVEIKPRAAQHTRQISLRKAIAENYIRWKGYDWKFIVVYDDEIVLSEEMLEVFESCCKLKTKSAFYKWFEQMNRRYDRSAPNFFARVPGETDIRYIMFGKRSLKNQNSHFR